MLADASNLHGEVVALARKHCASVQALGTLAAFLALPESEQRSYAEVSLLELSAFVRWQRTFRMPTGQALSMMEIVATWDDLPHKEDWLPEDPRALLEADGQWAPLLADGPPPCGDPHRDDFAMHA